MTNHQESITRPGGNHTIKNLHGSEVAIASVLVGGRGVNASGNHNNDGKNGTPSNNREDFISTHPTFRLKFAFEGCCGYRNLRLGDLNQPSLDSLLSQVRSMMTMGSSISDPATTSIVLTFQDKDGDPAIIGSTLEFIYGLLEYETEGSLLIHVKCCGASSGIHSKEVPECQPDATAYKTTKAPPVVPPSPAWTPHHCPAIPNTVPPASVQTMVATETMVTPAAAPHYDASASPPNPPPAPIVPAVAAAAAPPPQTMTQYPTAASPPAASTRAAIPSLPNSIFPPASPTNVTAPIPTSIRSSQASSKPKRTRKPTKRKAESLASSSKKKVAKKADVKVKVEDNVDQVKGNSRLSTKDATRNTDISNQETSTSPLPVPQEGSISHKICCALMELYALNILKPLRIQVALLSGYSHQRSTGFQKALSQLSQMHLIEYPDGKSTSLTAGALASLKPVTPPKDNEAAQERLCRLLIGKNGKVGSTKTTIIFGALKDGQVHTREAIAQASGHSHLRSTGFTKGLSFLSSMGLVSYPDSKTVQLTDIAFPYGRPQGT